jgi:hypothetical protein
LIAATKLDSSPPSENDNWIGFGRNILGAQLSCCKITLLICQVQANISFPVFKAVDQSLSKLKNFLVIAVRLLRWISRPSSPLLMFPSCWKSHLRIRPPSLQIIIINLFKYTHHHFFTAFFFTFKGVYAGSLVDRILCISVAHEGEFSNIPIFSSTRFENSGESRSY